jgi:hypothetical protein
MSEIVERYSAAELVEALRLHALDDCNGAVIETHLCNIAAAFVEWEAAKLSEAEAEIARLREALEERKSETNDEGLLPCPKCESIGGPHLYWWTRGQAWLVICSDCKHEAKARESHEYAARSIWNNEAEAARTALEPRPVSVW